jgi:hypothetical protein
MADLFLGATIPGGPPPGGGAENWFDGNDSTFAAVLGFHTSNVWDCAAPVAVASILIKWRYGTFGGGAAGAFAIDGSADGLSGWTEVLADVDPVGTAGASYPGDFEHEYDLGGVETYQFWRWRSTTLSNNDMWTISGFGEAVTPPPDPGPIVDVFDPDDVFLGALDDAFDIKLRPELNGTGYGSFKLRRDNSEVDLIEWGNAVKVTIPRIDPDSPLFMFFMETIRVGIVSEEEDGGEVIQVEGRGELSYIDRYVAWNESFVVPNGSPPDGTLIGPAATGNKAGQILWRMIQEGIHEDRPQHPWPLLTIDFDQDDDSDGNTWTETEMTAELSIGYVGERGLQGVRELVGTGEIDILMTPDYVLHGYNSYGRDLTGADFGAGVVRFVKGVNIADRMERQQGTAIPITHLLVRGTGVWATADLPDAAGRPTVEGFLQTEGTDVPMLEEIGLSELIRQLRYGESAPFQAMVPMTEPDEDIGDYLPGPEGTNGQYWLGDSVTLHTGTGFRDFNNEAARVVAMTITFDEANNLRCYPELLATAILGRFPTTGSRGEFGSAPPSSGSGGGAAPPAPPPPTFALAGHIADTVDAHDAQAISLLDAGGNYAATNVEDALDEAADDLAAHLSDAADAHDASAVSVVPFGTIAATTVQAALEEIATEAGGSIEVSDGTTSVDPTSLLSFDPAFFEVSDEGGDEALVTFIGEAGGGAASAFVGCHVYRTTAQTVTTGGLVALGFNAERFDSDGFHDNSTNNSRMTVPAGMAGKYVAAAAVEWAASSAGARTVGFKVNGTTYVGLDTVQPSSAGGQETRQVVTSPVLDLAAGDYVEVFISQSSGGNLDTGTTQAYSAEGSLFLIGAGGAGTAIGASAYHNTTQSLSGGAVFSLNSEDFDSDGFHDNSTNNSRMTIPAGLGGKYLIVGHFYTGTGTERAVSLIKNGIAGTYIRGSYSAAQYGGIVSAIADLAAGDYVEMYTTETATFGHASSVERMSSLSLVRIGSGGSPGLYSARAKRTSGSITLNSTSWANVDTGLDLTVKAVVGDVLQVNITGLAGSASPAIGFDAVTLVSGSPVTSVSGSDASDYGFIFVPALGDTPISGTIQYVVQSGDISGGNVTLRLRYKTSSATNRTLYAGTGGNPQFNWSVANLGQRS